MLKRVVAGSMLSAVLLLGACTSGVENAEGDMSEEQLEKAKEPTEEKVNENEADDEKTEDKTVADEPVEDKNNGASNNPDSAEKESESSTLYKDKMVTDNVAEKKIIFAKEDINESKAIEGIIVTLDGVQYATVTPTKGQEQKFSNIGEGPLVAVTAKLTVENASGVAFSKVLIGKKLHVDQNGGMVRSEGMLEPTVQGELNSGETDEVIAVFLVKEDEFNMYKELTLEFGPLKDTKAQKLFEEKSVLFTLPMK